MICLAQIPLAQSHLQGPNGRSGEADWVEVIEEEVQAQKPDKQTKSLLSLQSCCQFLFLLKCSRPLLCCPAVYECLLKLQQVPSQHQVTAKEPSAKRAKTDAPQILPIGRLSVPRPDGPDMGAFHPRFARMPCLLKAKSQGQSHAQTTIDSACALPSIFNATYRFESANKETCRQKLMTSNHIFATGTKG